MNGTATTTSSSAMEAQTLLTREDLARRWQAPGATPAARDLWVRRRCIALRLSPLKGFDRGKGARFRPATVQRAEAMAAGERL